MHIVVGRSYAIASAASSEGYRADGRIVAIRADVLLKLEPIAAVEASIRALEQSHLNP